MNNFYKRGSVLSIAMAIAFVFSMASAYEFEPVVYGETYKISETSPLYLEIKIDNPGYLTIQQKGTWDSHLFSIPDPTSIEAAILADGYKSNFIGGYDMSYSLTPGSYYFIAPFSYDTITEAIFNFEEGSMAMNLIKEGEPFIAGMGNSAWVFHCETTGVLQVATNYNGNLAAAMSFLYYDSLFKDACPYMDYKMTAKGSDYYFNVKEGESYYLFYDSYIMPVSMTFTVDENSTLGEVVILTHMEPAPGSAFDVINYHQGAILTFSPLQISFDNVTFSYIPEGSQEWKNVEVKARYFNNDYRIDIINAYKEALTEVELGSKCVVTVYGVNYEGTPLTESLVEGVNIEGGNLSFEYVLDMPPTLEEKYVPEVFYSYWPEGDAAGIATFTFTDDIKAATDANVIFARIESDERAPGDEEIYSVSISPIIDGKTVKYDFTGVERVYDTNVVTFRIPSITGENGLYADFGDGATSFWVYMDYEVVSGEGSVGKIKTDLDGVYNVFDISGVKVMTTDRMEMLETLPNGLYIINGVKVLKR